jgi:hypothetical protein
MSSPEPQSLAARIASSDAYSPAQQVDILSHVRRLRDGLPRGPGSDLSTKLTLASTLLEHLAIAGAVTPEAALAMAGELVNDVERSLETVSEGPKVLRAVESDEGEGLRMAGARLLGEILVEMKVATAKQVEDAVQEQRCTGVRLGETLMVRGLLTRRQLKQALEVQSEMQRTIGRFAP